MLRKPTRLYHQFGFAADDKNELDVDLNSLGT